MASLSNKGLLPRSMRHRRQSAEERPKESEHEAHYRLLSGRMSREKKARREIFESLREDMMSESQTNTKIKIQSASEHHPDGREGIGTPLLGMQVENTTRSTNGGMIAQIDAPRGMSLPPHKRRTLRTKHSLMYRLLSGRSHHKPFVCFNRFLASIIIINVIAFVLESYPSLGSEDSLWAPYFYCVEAVSSTIFMLEYFARMWTVPESRWYRKRFGPGHSGAARLRYCVTIRSMVDLASSLPFFIELCIPGHDLPTFTWLRLFRLFRILKSERSVRAFSSVYRVVWYNSEILGIALFIGCLLMMATSTLLWYLQPPDPQGDQFDSIPATFYLSILMLTGQGTPEGVLPWYTKVIVMCTAVFSVPIFVIPSSMLTWGFEAEAERLMRRKREVRRKEKEAREAGLHFLPSSSSSSDSITGSDTDDVEREWDEYEDVVLGETESEGKGKNGDQQTNAISAAEKRLIRDVAKFFAAADADGSGLIDAREFYNYQRDALRKRMAADRDTNGETDDPTRAMGHRQRKLARREQHNNELTSSGGKKQMNSSQTLDTRILDERADKLDRIEAKLDELLLILREQKS